MSASLRAAALLAASVPLVLVQELSAQAPARPLQPATCSFAGEPWAAGLDAECRWLVVPENRGRPAGPEVRLFVVVLRADPPARLPPVVMLHGGPGMSALIPMVRGAATAAARDRDRVFYDQRGAGLSEPDPCPDYAQRTRELTRGMAAFEARTGDRSALVRVARECVAGMRARGLDPAAWNTADNAADLADLRRSLGYERWDIYGASYGARLALEAMRHDPEGIRAVVLENPVPPGAESESALATQYAIQRVFASCARSDACNAAFPSLEQTFHAVYDTLTRSPLAIPQPDGGNAALDGEGLVLAVRRSLRSRDGISSLPLLLRELRDGDRQRAARDLVRLQEATGLAGRAVFWLVQCYDEYGPAYLARLENARSRASRPFRNLRDNLQECPIWQTRFAPAEGRTVPASDIPTLILVGEFDPRTPIEFGRQIAATLSHAYVFEFPGETHGGRPAPCRASVLAQFLTDPYRRPDASCIGRMPPFEFRTAWSPQ
jgi:pimeloyl-ACP methyl ester carboxylesterase